MGFHDTKTGPKGLHPVVKVDDLQPTVPTVSGRWVPVLCGLMGGLFGSLLSAVIHDRFKSPFFLLSIAFFVGFFLVFLFAMLRAFWHIYALISWNVRRRRALRHAAAAEDARASLLWDGPMDGTP